MQNEMKDKTFFKNVEFGHIQISLVKYDYSYSTGFANIRGLTRT